MRATRSPLPRFCLHAIPGKEGHGGVVADARGRRTLSYLPQFLLDGRWIEVGVVFATEAESREYEFDLRRHWHRPTSSRSIPSDEPATHLMREHLETIWMAQRRADEAAARRKRIGLPRFALFAQSSAGSAPTSS